MSTFEPRALPQATLDGGGGRRARGRASALLLWCIPLLAGLAAWLIAADAIAIPAAAVAIVLLVYFSLRDVRFAYMALVGLAAFVDYGGGFLTRWLSIVCAWAVLLGILMLWRSSWKTVVFPRASVGVPVAIWIAWACFGALNGWLKSNNEQHLGLEFLGALWPLIGLVAMQLFGRENLGYVLVGLVVVTLPQVPYGLIEMKKEGIRIGGVYFICLTGLAAMGLWVCALLTPSRRVRFVALLASMPLLLHVLLSFTRSFWLGFLVALGAAAVLVWWNLGWHEPEVRWRRMLHIPVFAGLLGLTALVGIAVSGEKDLLGGIGRRFGTSFSTEANWETASNFFRLVEYDEAISWAKQSPIVGQGFGHMHVLRDPFFGTRFLEGTVHDYYLFLWLKLGAVGLAAFALLIGSTLWAAFGVARRASDWKVRAWAIGTIAITVQVLTISVANYPLGDVNAGFYLGTIWGVLWSLDRQIPPFQRPSW
jgi:O-antigen ligase